MRHLLFYMFCLLTVSVLGQSVADYTVDDVITDIYYALSENEATDYDDLHEHLLAFTEQPIDLNSTSREELLSLRFLSEKQIDDLLLYVHAHPMDSLYELRLIGSFKDYEIRNLLPFVTLRPIVRDKRLYVSEVFRMARHDLTLRTDGRYMEDPQRDNQTDPVYARLRYRFNYGNRVVAGLTMQRPTGAAAKDMLYGGFLRVSDIGIVHTLVAGQYQASFGQGLVTASPLHFGKLMYAASAVIGQEGLRTYSSVATPALQGAGLTLRHKDWDVSTWYSLNRQQDSLRHHRIGCNLTWHRDNLTLQLTMTEHLYSDSVRYYFANAAYNQHYFRGDKQWVGGISFRYAWRRWIWFGEAAATQNRRWGAGTVLGARYLPWDDVTLTALYRYYSPWFDNPDGYAFSETSRLNDENGLYVAADVKRCYPWRWTLYGDVFRFSGVKYGITYAPSWGYDAAAQTTYYGPRHWHTDLRLRARQKGEKATYSLRYRFVWQQAGWYLLSQADVNLVQRQVGYSLMQDVHYSFPSVPLTLQLSLCGFRALQWDNRIYHYERDVLYAFSNYAAYGLGGRAYLNVRWKIIPQLSLYLRLSQTVYARNWVQERSLPAPTRTDLHLLLRATL